MARVATTTEVIAVLLLAACHGATANDAAGTKLDGRVTAPSDVSEHDFVLAGSPGCEPRALPEPALHLQADLYHSCAWSSSMGVWCWGDNSAGELDDGTMEAQRAPVRTRLDASEITQLDLGHVPTGGFSCALTKHKTVERWGSNDTGQLGDGTTAARGTPAPVLELSDVSELAVGAYHSCAGLANGHVKCWGRGQACDLGDGGCSSSATPVEVIGLANATQLAVGVSFSCALTTDATVVCWGGNSNGEAGVGSRTAVLRPTPVIGLANVVGIAAGLTGACAQTCNGSVWCWGQDGYGLLGVDVQQDVVASPLEVPGIPCGAILMPGGRCAVTPAGDAYCWGASPGDGKMSQTKGAARVPLEQVVAVAGYRSLIALARDGSVWAWGYNERGQLGDGTLENRWSPVPISLPR